MPVKSSLAEHCSQQKLADAAIQAKSGQMPCVSFGYGLQGAGQMTGVVVAFYADLQPLREDGLVRVVETVAPLARASEVSCRAGASV